MPERNHDSSSQNKNIEEPEFIDNGITPSNDRAVGSKILSSINFEQRHKPIVDSSFEKAKNHGEKMQGTGPERRNLAYLSRIESLVEKYGDQAERKLWQKSVNKLIVRPEDIPESYWRTQEQILRDNGQAHRLGDFEKETLIDDIQRRQCSSLKSWSNYLGHPDSPYPLWFKVYAWDGMSKMGAFNKENEQFAKRDKHTVAPYPQLNPAVLAEVFSVVSDFYGLNNDERKDGKAFEGEELYNLVATGNFNKLYSKILLSQKSIPLTPERTEDVRGEWLEYLPGDENELAVAAEGTPWCVATSEMGRDYLEYDEYGDYVGRSSDDNHAKFILFHLQNPETNTLSASACASIRLGIDGRVAEISGLKDGQALEDSLIPIVEAKVKTLPGGEDFLEAFADKQKLISLDHKLQADEDLTKEELEFLYEAERPIKNLDTYNSEDPRLTDLRKRYTLYDCMDKGVDLDGILLNSERYLLGDPADGDLYRALVEYGASPDCIDINIAQGGAERDYSKFVAAGADPNSLVAQGLLSPGWTIGHIDQLIDDGADIDTMAELLCEKAPNMVVYAYDRLQRCGADIDLSGLMDKIDGKTVVDNLSFLLDKHIEVNLQEVVEKLEPQITLRNLRKLIEAGADISVNKLLIEGRLKINEEDIENKLVSDILHYGGNPDILIYDIPKSLRKKCLFSLILAGVDWQILVAQVEGTDINEFAERYPALWRDYADRAEQRKR